MNLHLTAEETRLLQRALELAAGYANTEREEAAILELSAQIRVAQRTVPPTTEAHDAVAATISAIKYAARREPITHQLLDRVAAELTAETAPHP